MGFQQDIVGLRDQIKENAVLLFPKVVEEHYKPRGSPLKNSDAFNIQIIRVNDEGFKGILTCQGGQSDDIAAVGQLTTHPHEGLRALLVTLSKSLFEHLETVKHDDEEILSMLRAETGDWVNPSMK